MRRVRCIDCGFLHRGWRSDGASISRPIGLRERGTIQRGQTMGDPATVECSRGVIDPHEGMQHLRRLNTWGEDDLEPEYAPALAAELTKRRACPYFYRFQPGNSPEEHLKLQLVDQHRRSDRSWDRKKLGLTLAMSLLAGAVGGLLTQYLKLWLEGSPLLR